MDWSNRLARYKLAIEPTLEYGDKEYITSYEEMLAHLKRPEVGFLKILEVIDNQVD